LEGFNLNFDASEVYQFAIGIEENGEAFYRKIAKEVDDEDVKKFFNKLADDELNHKKRFESMLSMFKDYKPLDIYPEEYFSYLRAHIKGDIFPSEISKETLKEVKNLINAVNYSMERELDSIFYYTDIKDVIHDDQKNLIDDIISEEKKHFLKLSNFLKDLERS